MAQLSATALPPLPRHEIDEVVRDLDGLWSELRGSRIFLTGATGFFGVWLLETLLAANARQGLGVEVVVLSRDPAAFARKQPQLAGSSALRWVRGAVTTLDAAHVGAELGCPHVKFDVILHLATESDNSATLRNPPAAVAVIADGTRRVLDFAQETGVRRMLFTSSGSVCARIVGLGELLTEDHMATTVPLDGVTAYGISGEAKRSAEAMCVAAARERGLEISVARCFSFAGPGMPLDGKFAFGNFLRDALAKQPIVIQGDGTPVRSYLYAGDLTRWLWTILLRGEPGRTYNVGSEAAVSMRDLAKVIAREIGSESTVDVMGVPAAGRAVDFYVPSTARVHKELGLSERVTLPDAIRRTATWLSSA